MSDTRLVSSERPVRRVLGMALAVLLLTSVHHVYGAFVYDTPWRLHVVLFAGLAAAALLGSLRVFQGRPAHRAGNIAFRVFAAVVLVVPVAAIGVFEGGYNHALKNALFFAGASPAVMRSLFPPPAYELPNDVFFEVTGVLQLVLGAATAWSLWSLIRERSIRRAKRDPSCAAA